MRFAVPCLAACPIQQEGGGRASYHLVGKQEQAASDQRPGLGSRLRIHTFKGITGDHYAVRAAAYRRSGQPAAIQSSISCFCQRTDRVPATWKDCGILPASRSLQTCRGLSPRRRDRVFTSISVGVITRSSITVLMFTCLRLNEIVPLPTRRIPAIALLPERLTRPIPRTGWLTGSAEMSLRGYVDRMGIT